MASALLSPDLFAAGAERLVYSETVFADGSVQPLLV